MSNEDLYLDEQGNVVPPEELGNYDVVSQRSFDTGSTWDAIKSIPMRAAVRGAYAGSGLLQAVGDYFGSDTIKGLADTTRQNTQNAEQALNTATNFSPGGVNENVSNIGGNVLLGLPAMLSTGPVGAATVLGGTSAADKYGQLRAQGASPSTAGEYATYAGLKDAALSIPMTNPVFKEGLGTLGRIGLGALYGAPSGAAGGALDESINQLALNQPIDPSKIAGAAKFGGISGGAMGAAMGTLGSPKTQDTEALKANWAQADQAMAQPHELPPVPVDNIPNTPVVEPKKPVVLEDVQQKTTPEAPATNVVKPHPVETKQATTPIVEEASKEVGFLQAAKKVLDQNPEAGVFTPGDLLDGAAGLANKVKAKLSTGSDIEKLLDEMGIKKGEGPGQNVSRPKSEAEQLFDSEMLGAIRKKVIFPSTVAQKDKTFDPIFRAALEGQAHTFRTADNLNESFKPYMALDDASRAKVDAFAEYNRLQTKNEKPVFQSPDEMKFKKFSDKEIQGYHSLRNGLDNALDIYGGALKNRLANIPEGPGKAAAFTEIDNLVAKLRGGHYLPFGRFGDHFIRVLDNENNTQSYFMFESSAQAKAYKKALLGRGQKIEEGKIQAPSNQEYQGIPFNLLVDVSEKLRAVSPEAHQQFQDVIGEMVNLKKKQLQPTGGVGTHFMKAELVPGYTKDFRRVIADYSVGLSHFDAHSKWAPQMEAAYAKMPDNNSVKVYARKYIDDLKKPDPKLISHYQKLAAAYLLSRPSSAVTNLTQSFTNTLPEIWNQLGKNGKSGTARIFVESGSFAEKYLTTGKLKDAELKSALDDAMKAGLVSEQTYREMSRTAAGKNSADPVAGLTYAFRKMEVFNRTTAYIAGWKVGKKIGLKDQQLKDYAANFNDTTQFVQGKANRPEMARGALAPLFTFKLFSGHQIRYLRNGFSDGNWRRLIGSPVASLLLGGLPALAGGKEIIKALEQQGYDPRGKLKANAKNSLLGGVLYGGIPHVLDIANFSGALGTGDILPELDNPMTGITKTVGGVPLSLGMRVAKAKDQLDKGYTLKGIGQLLPEVVRSPLDALDAGMRGKFIAGDGTVLVQNPTAYELGTKAMGFMPPRLADAYTDNQSRRLLENRSKEVSGDTNWQIGKALAEGDIKSARRLYQDALARGYTPNEGSIKSWENKLSSKLGADTEWVKSLPKRDREEAIRMLTNK